MSGPVERRAKGAGHGGSARGYTWPPFEGGNDAAVKHGCYARLKLAPRAREINDELRSGVVPVHTPADDATIDALSMILAQLERATLVLGSVQAREPERIQDGKKLDGDDRDDLRRLSADARGWANVALRYFETLGLTPTARARLGLDVAAMQRQLSVIDYYDRQEREDVA